MEGRVYKSTGSWYFIKDESGNFVKAKLKGKFRIKGLKSTNPVAVGDLVNFEIEKIGDEALGIIDEIKERHNYIIRKSVNLSKQTHILASNIDMAFLLITYNNPPTSTTFIDRFLVTAEAYHIPVTLLFNKVDSYELEEFAEMKFLAEAYREIGYECIGISALTGKNINQVKEIMTGKTSLVSGHSGTGKSTLINALEPGLDLKTSQISEQHLQGQHTTTFAEMFDLSFDARIIDTPGIKGFGVVDIDKNELGDYFPEFLALKQECKFNNCLHIDEPHCAVKEALEEDEIHYFRYQSYLQILDSEDDNYRKDQYQNSK
ncbi:ribosome small subunit-dependent GTPase A [Psychroflexus halocasei]|uniref:Small ribosomal subunit biogenesis GTPase RsgA n=1 Tax=Psychroflexus halocasei TaxID=908615 RepID=A0A1H3ZP48_9FLAO|nr:ribosome small subunit-dependent GTPase A [Psychroflexus halocasei]SEA25012.1 ribosome biogenesis GTPase [Psychroflexus halocasei]